MNHKQSLVHVNDTAWLHLEHALDILFAYKHKRVSYVTSWFSLPEMIININNQNQASVT